MQVYNCDAIDEAVQHQSRGACGSAAVYWLCERGFNLNVIPHDLTDVAFRSTTVHVWTQFSCLSIICLWIGEYAHILISNS